VLAVPIYQKSALRWDQQRLGKSIDGKYLLASLRWNHAVLDGYEQQAARRRSFDWLCARKCTLPKWMRSGREQS